MIFVLLPPSEHCICVQCVALCQATTYVLSAGEAARYKAKALMTDNTLLEICSADTIYVASRFAHSSSKCTYQTKCTQPLTSLVTKPRPTNHTSQCVIRAWPDVFIDMVRMC